MSVNTKVNGELVKSAGLYSVTKPIGMADIYSTEEKEVGLWIDNKPLYQRTLTIDTIASTLGVQRFAHNIANIETAFAISGTWLQKSDDSVYIGTKDIIRTDGSGNINVGKGSVGVWVDATNIIIDTTENRSSQYVIVTIQYTKTTDTPWSGKFVPQGYGYVSSGDIYSLEERQVGVWTDGKPLYQKTFVTEKTNILGNSDIDITSDITAISADEIITYNEHLIYTYTSSGSTTTGEYWSDDLARLAVVSNGYAIRLTIGGATLNTVKITWTITYTKTTDVAGSGEYVPSGDKAVHYSTDEEVIGTWLGKTLYRRVFDLGADISIANNAFATTTIDASSMETLVDAKAIYSTGVTVYNIMANINNNIIRLQADRNDNAISARYIILEYTKTS